MSVRPKKEKKQSKGPAGMTEQELKNLKFKKRLKSMRSAKPAERRIVPFDMDKIDMSMPPDRRTDEQKKQDAIDALLGDTASNLKLTPEMLKSVADSMKPMKKGGEVKKYMGGGSVHKKKNKMATTKGWGASRKT
jgi:hypothetical protein